ncbi:MAG: GNAT family N-acetyltransferase [Zetaproteobacteria bacterium]|nr:GNAT family N-acetyltransferase [Zetaproteobacteria bacterium]
MRKIHDLNIAEHDLRYLCSTWGYHSYADVATALGAEQSRYHFWSVTFEQQVVGALYVLLGVDSAEVMYIYVGETQRGQGIGGRLLRYLERFLIEHQVKEVFLEVKSNNCAARQLYIKSGFTEIGRRRAYYADGEDALVYKKVLEPSRYVSTL